MTSFEMFSIFISLLAVIISAVSLVRTRKISAQQLELEKITAELSEKQLARLHSEAVLMAKAFIDVELIKSGTTHKIVITNTGGSEAKNVNFHIDGDQNPLVGNDYAEKIPIKSLKPGKKFIFWPQFRAKYLRHSMDVCAGTIQMGLKKKKSTFLRYNHFNTYQATGGQE